MKKSITSFVKSIFAGITLIAMSAAVQATPISYTYTQALTPAETLETSLALSFWEGLYRKKGGTKLSYDLSGGSWSTGSYDPAIDTLTSLDLTLSFLWKPFAALTTSLTTSFGDLSHTASSIWNNTTTFSLANIDLNNFNSYDLGSDIELTLNSLGSVVLTGYTLAFSGTRADLAQAVPVPTPSSLALLSAGLLGAGWFSRRRAKLANS